MRIFWLIALRAPVRISFWLSTSVLCRVETIASWDHDLAGFNVSSAARMVLDQQPVNCPHHKQWVLTLMVTYGLPMLTTAEFKNLHSAMALWVSFIISCVNKAIGATISIACRWLDNHHAYRNIYTDEQSSSVFQRQFSGIVIPNCNGERPIHCSIHSRIYCSQHRTGYGLTYGRIHDHRIHRYIYGSIDYTIQCFAFIRTRSKLENHVSSIEYVPRVSKSWFRVEERHIVVGHELRHSLDIGRGASR